jgi:hypothetical protein
MHLYIALKGVKMEVDQFITELQGKYLPIKWREKKEDPFVDANIQLGVRPIQLYEIGYPKEHHDLVCATILGDNKGVFGNDGKKGTEHKWVQKFIYFFRKLLHLDPIPEYKLDRFMPLRKQHITIIGLGTKQDYIMPNGVEGI